MPQKPKIFKKGDKLYDVPSNEVTDFLNEMPDAVEINVYEKDGKTFDVPLTELDDFMQQVPGATLLEGSKKKVSTPAADLTKNKPGRGSMGLSPLPASVGESIIAGEPEKDPILKRLSEKNNWFAAPINFLTGAVKGTGEHIMKPLDGAQRLFYKGVGSLMEMSGSPGIMAEGMKLKAQQDDPKHGTWFKNAQWGIERVAEGGMKDGEYIEPKLPEPMKGDFFSALVYNLGELAPFMGTLAVTPNPSLFGVGTKLPINIAGQSAMSTYADTGDLAESVKAGAIGLGDGALLMMMGYGAGKSGQWITKNLKNTLGPAAGITGTTAGAGMMYGGGVSNSVSKQLLNGVGWENLDWDQANQEGALFFALGVPGIVSAAASTYLKAPKESIALARRAEVDINVAREKAFELFEKAEKETDPAKKTEYHQAAEAMNRLTDVKAMEEYFGKNAEQARKDIQESELSEADKKAFLERIDEAELHQQQIKESEKAREDARGEIGLKIEETEGGKFQVTQEGTKEAPEFDTLKEAESFKEKFETITGMDKGMKFKDKKAQTDKDVASGKKKKPEPKVTKVEPKEKVDHVTAETSEKYADLTETPEGDYVFYHYSPEKRTVIDPKKSGSNKGAITGKEEMAAASTVGGISHYYPNTSKVESGVGKNQHTVRVPKEKVYDGNADPLNLAAEAKKQFKEQHPDLGFSPNHKMAWITKLAGEKGFDMVLVDWAGRTRAQSTKAMTPEAVEGTPTSGKGFKKQPPVKAEGAYVDVLGEINKHQNTKGVYDELYHAEANYMNPKNEMYQNKEALTKLVEKSDLPKELKEKYTEALETKDVPGKAVKDPTTEQVGTHKKEGGSTYSVDGKNLMGTEGTSVGLFPERSKTFKGELTDKHLDLFKKDNADLLKGNEDILGVGTWYKKSTGENVLDIVAVIPREKAIELGTKYKQEAVFDLAKGEEIPTGGSGKAEAIGTEAGRISEARMAAGRKPPAKPPKGPPKPPEEPGELPGPEGKPERDVMDVMKDIKQEQKKAMKKRGILNKLRPSYLFYDQQEPFKRAVQKAARLAGKGKEVAQRVLDRKNVEKGSKARTAMDFSKAMKDVTGGIKGFGSKEMELISDINDMRRTSELYKSREAMGKEKLLMEGGISLKQAEDFLTKVRKKDPAILEQYGLKDYDPKKVREASDKFNEKYRDILDELLAEGLIRKEAYDAIVFEHPYYSPRKFIQSMDKMDPGGSMSGVESLKGGSEGAKIVDAPSLYFDALSRKNAMVARARTFRAMEDYVREVGPNFLKQAEYTPEFLEKMSKAEQGDPWIEPKFKDTPKGMEAVDYLDANGNRKRFHMDAEVHKYFDIEPFGDLSRKIMNYAGWISGTKPLKMAATGYNPEFMVKNVPIDMMHILNTTDVYSGALPVAYAQMSLDMARVAKDVATRSGTYTDYINEGGGMKMLTGEGRLREGISKRKLQKATQIGEAIEGLASWPGESSELITRLSLRWRHLENSKSKFAKENGREPDAKEVKEMQLDATAYARNYLDFEQGGRLIKMADSVIPYLNAGFQVTRGSLRAAGKNPGLYAAKVAQVAGASAAITAWNMGQVQTKNIDEEKGAEMQRFYLNDISDEVKARNFVVMTPLKYTDVNGVEKYLYFKLQKDNAQELITGVAEDRVHREIMGDNAPSYLSSRRLKELQVMTESATNVSQLPPAIRGALGYKLNKDFFYNSELWMGYDMGKDKSLEYRRDTPERYKAIGKIPLPGGHQLSPTRSHYMAKQFFTESNVIATGVGEMFDEIVRRGAPDMATEYTPGEVEKLKNTPFARRFLKSTYPGASKQGSDTHQQVYNRLKQGHNQKLESLMDAESSSEAVYEWMESIVEDGDGDITSIKEFERLERRYTEEVLMPAVNSWVERLKYVDAVPRAQDLFDQWVHMNDDLRDHLLESAAMAGVLSDDTVAKFSELMEEYEAEKEKMDSENSEAPTPEGRPKPKRSKRLGAAPELPLLNDVKGVDVDMDVEIEETGEKTNMTMSAMEVRKDIKRRYSVIDQLIKIQDEGFEG